MEGIMVYSSCFVHLFIYLFIYWTAMQYKPVSNPWQSSVAMWVDTTEHRPRLLPLENIHLVVHRHAIQQHCSVLSSQGSQQLNTFEDTRRQHKTCQGTYHCTDIISSGHLQLQYGPRSSGIFLKTTLAEVLKAEVSIVECFCAWI